MEVVGRDSLWRDRSFQLFWAGESISIAGTQITLVVLPILTFQLTGSASRTSVLLSIQAAPYLVFGLLAGAIADRTNRRALMIGANLLSAAAMASIPIAAALGVLTLAQIYIVGLVTATAFVWHDSASFGALPAIVGRDRVVPAFSAFVSTETALRVGATAVAGVLAATLGAATALWADAASYLVAALALALIPRAFGTPLPRQADGPRLVRRLARDVGEGLRFLRRHALVWPLTITGFGLSLTGGAVLGLTVVYGVRQLGLPGDDARLGWLFSSGAVGALLAAVALPRLVRRVSQPRLSLLAFVGNLVLTGGIALASSLPASLLLLFAWNATYTLIIVNGIALRQQLTPDRLQGRVNVTARMIAWGGQPFGAALGGLLADHTSIRITLLVMTLGVATSTAYGWLSPLRDANASTVASFAAEAEASTRPT
ncbi:MAG: MFS transporter [Egibacteraceae bacterium]